MRDTCDPDKVKVVRVKKWTCFTKPLDIQKFHKHAETALNVV